jgi:hypothetical protein
MQAEWGDRTIEFRAPTVDTSTGEVVRQSNPTNQQLTNVATADPGEEVQTDFTESEGDEEGNRNPTNTNQNTGGAVNDLFGIMNPGITNQNSTPDNEEDPNHDESGGGLFGLCSIC